MTGAAPLPGFDRIIASLVRRGFVDAARELGTLAVRRQDRAASEVREQLRRIEEGSPLRELADVAIDGALALGLVEHHRYHEARIVFSLTATEDSRGARVVRLLDVVIAPFPEDADPSFSAVHRLIASGQSPSCLRALEEVLRQSVDPPGWLVERHRALSTLVRGAWKTDFHVLPEVTREHVREMLHRRDLFGALHTARAAEDTELAAALSRLHAATKDGLTDPSYDPSVGSTAPIEGHTFAEQQVRMCALDGADRAYRSLLRRNPRDELARTMLTDVIVVRRALGEKVLDVPKRPPSVEVLDKRARARTDGPWAAGSNPPERFARYGDAELEESTDVVDPALEAELLLKVGKAASALAMYRLLAIRHPHRDRYRARADEIEAMLEQEASPMIAEITSKHSMESVPIGAFPSHDRIPIHDYPMYGADDDEEDTKTSVDALHLDED